MLLFLLLLTVIWGSGTAAPAPGKVLPPSKHTAWNGHLPFSTADYQHLLYHAKPAEFYPGLVPQAPKGRTVWMAGQQVPDKGILSSALDAPSIDPTAVQALQKDASFFDAFRRQAESVMFEPTSLHSSADRRRQLPTAPPPQQLRLPRGVRVHCGEEWTTAVTRAMGDRPRAAQQQWNFTMQGDRQAPLQQVITRFKLDTLVDASSVGPMEAGLGQMEKLGVRRVFHMPQLTNGGAFDIIVNGTFSDTRLHTVEGRPCRDMGKLLEHLTKPAMFVLDSQMCNSESVEVRSGLEYPLLTLMQQIANSNHKHIILVDTVKCLQPWRQCEPWLQLEQQLDIKNLPQFFKDHIQFVSEQPSAVIPQPQNHPSALPNLNPTTSTTTTTISTTTTTTISTSTTTTPTKADVATSADKVRSWGAREVVDKQAQHDFVSSGKQRVWGLPALLELEGDTYHGKKPIPAEWHRDQPKWHATPESYRSAATTALQRGQLPLAFALSDVAQNALIPGYKEPKPQELDPETRDVRDMHSVLQRLQPQMPYMNTVPPPVIPTQVEANPTEVQPSQEHQQARMRALAHTRHGQGAVNLEGEEDDTESGDIDHRGTGLGESIPSFLLPQEPMPTIDPDVFMPQNKPEAVEAGLMDPHVSLYPKLGDLITTMCIANSDVAMEILSEDQLIFWPDPQDTRAELHMLPLDRSPKLPPISNPVVAKAVEIAMATAAPTPPPNAPRAGVVDLGTWYDQNIDIDAHQWRVQKPVF